MQLLLKILRMLVLLLWITSTAYPQRGLLTNNLIYNDSTVIYLANNFIASTDVDYQPFDIRLPFKDLHFIAYGKHLEIAVFRKKELLDNGGYLTGGSFRDTIQGDAFVFNTANMYFQVTRNGKLSTDWTPVTHTGIYIDTFRNTLDDPSKFFVRRGLFLVADSLANGDSMQVKFRHRQEAPFLTLHFLKKDPQNMPPFLMFSTDCHDPHLKLEDFILDFYRKYPTKIQAGRFETFYADWPALLDRKKTPGSLLTKDTKTAYIFRSRKDIPNDSAFEYRVVVNDAPGAKWRKSGPVVFVSGLASGNRYRLEVRYADKPNLVFTKNFYVPAAWYQQPWVIILNTVLLLAFVTLLWLFFRQRWKKRQLEVQRSRIMALYAQLNPHFLFNALGSIQGLLNEGEVEKANQYLSGFGVLLRNTLNSGERYFVTLEQDLQHMQRYVSLEQLRRPFTYHVEVEPGLKLSDIAMLPMLLQPAIENALKHGYRGQGQTLTLNIYLQQQGNDLLIKIQDDGKGFDAKHQPPGKGLQLTAKRISIFNRFEKGKHIYWRVESSNTGTSVYFTFKNWLDD
ncbi:histidine kinase [Chitinophaga polysaccharea]|uniref:Histidine kinase n=1 Tax=Chitinophaga polysaccharea TaxID=1293035 RepID=A0A561PBA3_9BACT|nr:histidine kinase [Chitinophaga polysaccharea]TWF35340.1 histidine kinase [Chitinophaga polysaccharea]